MKRSFILLMAVFSVFAFSCKKSSSTSTTTTTTADYYMLKTGNYWVYQAYMIDSSGVATGQDQFDSAYIEKDTIIRGYTYYKLWERPVIVVPKQRPLYLRDSAGYLVDRSGARDCSDNDFTDILSYDTLNLQLFTGYLKMTGKDSVVTVPAGNFQSITSQLKVTPTPPSPYPVRYIYNVYGKNTGMIKSHNFYFNSYESFDGRLVRYKVQ